MRIIIRENTGYVKIMIHNILGVDKWEHIRKNCSFFYHMKKNKEYSYYGNIQVIK